MADIKLYGYSTSPFVRKLGCCLYYKNIDFEFVPVNPVDSKAIAFSNQTQVPVLKISDDWRTDSTPLAIWLDELFPDKPLFGANAQERELILAIDQWVTRGPIVGMFRTAYEAKMTAGFRHIAWRLSSIVSSQTPLSEEIRTAWPELLKQAPFIKRMMQQVDTSEALADMHGRLAMELLGHLKGGPYLGGLAQPSLADFAMFQLLVFNYMVGMTDSLDAALEPSLNAWIQRVKAHLPENPLLVPDYMVVNQL